LGVTEKRSIFLFLSFLLILCPVVRADHFYGLFEQSVFGRYALGLGARAWGMGGAQVAVLGDPAAASSWNPAGLASLTRPSVAISYARENLRLTPGDSGIAFSFYGTAVDGRIKELDSTASGSALDFAAVAYPFRLLGRTVAAQFSYRRQIPYTFNIVYSYIYRYTAYYSFNYDYLYNAAPTGGLDALTLSLAAEVIPGVRAGFNLHRWSNGFTLPTRESYAYYLTNYYGLDGDWREDLSDRVEMKGTGVSADFGLLADIQGKIFAGVVVRTGFEAGLEYEARLGSLHVPLRCGFFQEKHFCYDRKGERVASFGYAVGLGLRFGGAALDLAWVQARSKDHFTRDSLRVSLQYGL